MNLSIIILNYKTPGLVISCIASLEKNYNKEFKEKEFEIIVVDNASSDGSFEKIQNYATNKAYIQVFESGENLGFAKGCNFGADKAKGSHILFLNSDTQIENAGLTKMVSFMKEHSEVGILGGKLKNQDGSDQPSAGSFYTLINLLVMIFGGGRLGLLKKSPDTVEEVDWVSGACMMVNKKTFEGIGGFDGNLFMYMEDMELCFRAKREGIKTYFYPEVSVKHIGEGSSNRTFAILNIYKGILLFYKKYMSTWQYYLVKFCLWFKAILIYTIGRLTNNSYYINTYGQALKLFR